MKMIMRFGVSFDGNDFEKEYGYIDFGGYSFVVSSMNIPFDFEAFGYSIVNEKDNRICIEYESGQGFLFNEYEIDECFDYVYKELGLNKKDITAKFLASTSEIDEITISHEEKEFKNLKIDFIEFKDMNENIFEVNQNVIDKYNKKIYEEELNNA